MKPKSKILIIAGSDSSGGAGIQADIKTVTALGSYAMTAITVVTSQNTTGVKSIESITPREISKQIEFTSKDIKPDAIKIGMGPGSICTTRIIAGMGVPQITAILSIKEKLKSNEIPLVADGGIRFSGDISKALAAGADAVMLGGIFAGTEEAPGEVELYQGRSFKTYRGMGSLGAMSERNDVNRYSQDGIEKEKMVPEGVEGRVPFKGWVVSVIDQLTGGIRQSMGYVGCKTISQMQEDTQFIEITNAGMMESHVHDVMITKEAPNYQRS